VTDLVKHDRSDLDLAAVITKAVELNTPIETINRLWEMKKEMMRIQAEQEFNDALSRLQAATGRISADATNPQTRSQYASYAALDRVLRPLYTAEGLAISFDTGDAKKEDDVRVLAYVSHKGGFTKTYTADMDASGLGPKGAPLMTKTHARGAAMSYGMRYLLKLIFNVAVGEDDIDGNTTKTKVTPAGGTWDALTPKEQNMLADLHLAASEYLEQGDVESAVNLIDGADLNADLKVPFWAMFGSKQRRAMKDFKEGK